MKKYLMHHKRLALYCPKKNDLLVLCLVCIQTLVFCSMADAKSNFHNTGFDSTDIKFTPLSGEKNTVVSGQVTTEKGEPLAGVSVRIKGSASGTSTGPEGKYSISVPDNGVLIFSFTGYATQEIIVNNKPIIDVKLAQSNKLLGEVVVTALGIQKSSKAITYAVQKVNGAELNVVPQTNFMNSLSGKTAGVTVSSNASGIGGSVKVLIRGNKSIQGNNQPLYVIDGIPLVNNISGTITNTNGGRDGGDGISNLNPDDIASMSILKGASAAALYGSAAANGVILITTKKGKAGVTKVNFSSSYTSDKVAYTPDLQNKYGATSPGAYESWGAPIKDASDNISTFFKTGNTFVNAISFSSGTEKGQTYFSYANTTGNGIIPNNTLSRHNINFHVTSQYFNNKLSIDVNGNFINQTLNNSPQLGLQNAITSLYLFPRGVDFSQYENPTVYDPVRKLMVQNWYLPNSSIIMNPYWEAKYMQYKNARNRAIIGVTAKYIISNSLSFEVRANVDKTNDVNTAKLYAGASTVISGLNGRYEITNLNNTLYYSDALLNFARSFGKIKLNGVLGGSINDSHADGTTAGSSALYIPNVFTLQNMDPSSQTTSTSSISTGHSQLQALFGNIGASYDDWLFLDLTGRNDWSSNLSYTPNGSYFYPSAGISLILNQVLKLPEVISLAKLRGSYSIVGNSVPIYVTNPLNYISRGGGVQFNTTAPFSDLNPEKTRSMEIGTELGFFDNQLSASFTYYKTNSTNQFFSILVPPGTGYSTRFINAGNIQNSGIELTLAYSTSAKRPLQWNTQVNFSTNKNTVKTLAAGVDQFVLGQDNNFYFSILKPGGSYGDIYGPTLQRDSATGKILIGADGIALVTSGTPAFLGNPNPKFQLGWSNSFGYKNFIISFLFDGKFGGKVLSMTQMLLDGEGQSKASGDARDNGGVTVNGMLADGTSVTKVDAYKWYYGNFGNKINSNYMYDATVIRLREVSVGYSLPASILKKGFVKDIRLSVIGRNLAYLYKPAPFDPEITYSVGNSFSGIDAMNLPATRSFGLNLTIVF